MPWPLYTVTPTASAVLALRVYANAKCPHPGNPGYHNAIFITGHESLMLLDAGYDGTRGLIPNEGFDFPKACACGYEFQKGDKRVVCTDRLYEGGGYVGTFGWAFGRFLPVGACIAAPPDTLWGDQAFGPVCEDGRHWFILLPGRTVFELNSPTREKGKLADQPGWTHTDLPEPGNPFGMLPLQQLTVTPSINIVGTYHGHIKDGVVGEDEEGRKFDLYGTLLP